MRLTPITRPGIMLAAACVMAAVSGLISYWGPEVPLSLDDAWPYPIRKLIYGLLTPDITDGHGHGFWHPGYAFAVVLAVLLLGWGRVGIGRALVAFPVSIAAWAAAFWLAVAVISAFDPIGVGWMRSPAPAQCVTRDASGYQIHDRSGLDPARRAACEEIDRYREQITPLMTRLTWLVNGVAGLAAGLVGALICVLGLAVVSPNLRSLAAVVLVAGAGAAAGLLFAPYQLAWRGESEPLKALLFIVWQASVAMAIAWRLARS